MILHEKMLEDGEEKNNLGKIETFTILFYHERLPEDMTCSVVRSSSFVEGLT